MTIGVFQRRILEWYKTNNRDWLRWRQTRDPYRILVSEIMLQQTQVSRVLQKYPEFLRVFPTIHHLAKAPLTKVLNAWQGMGYNRRALYLKRAAQEIVKTHNGKIPPDPKELQKLPGIGLYTAGAIACFAFNKPVVFLDTNIRKVFIHLFFSKSKKKVSDKQVITIAEKTFYKKDPRKWHYALMDYGAMALGREKGILERAKTYYKQSPFLGSTRYFRSKIVRHLLKEKCVSGRQLVYYLKEDHLFSSHINIATLLSRLKRDKIIKQDGAGYYSIG